MLRSEALWADGLCVSIGHPWARAIENDPFCPLSYYQAALENEHCWVKRKQQMTFCFPHKLVYRIFVSQTWFSRRCANIAAILAVGLLFKPEHKSVGAGMSIYISELLPCKIPWIPNILVCIFCISLFLKYYCSTPFLKHNFTSVKKRWSYFQNNNTWKLLPVCWDYTCSW